MMVLQWLVLFHIHLWFCWRKKVSWRTSSYSSCPTVAWSKQSAWEGRSSSSKGFVTGRGWERFCGRERGRGGGTTGWGNYSVTQIYSIIRILGGEYFVFEYEYLFSSVRIYLIFVFGQIDLTNIYSVHIRYGFGGYSAYIRYIFEYQAPNIHYSYTNILFHWNEYIQYSYSVKI